MTPQLITQPYRSGDQIGVGVGGVQIATPSRTHTRTLPPATTRRDMLFSMCGHVTCSSRAQIGLVHDLAEALVGDITPHCGVSKVYLTHSVYKIVLQKSIPAHIRQLILYYYKYTE